MARWARARNHEKRSFCPSWTIRCVCSLWATSTWTLPDGVIGSSGDKVNVLIGGVADCDFQQNWTYRILMDAVYQNHTSPLNYDEHEVG